MTVRSAVATEAAQRLWARASNGVSASEEVAAAIELMCDQLGVGLSRWVGAPGYRVLLSRAMGMTVKEYPILGGIACLGGSGAFREGNTEVVAGVTALVATVIDLLGAIIGEDMAVRLVEQAGMPGPRLVVNTEKKRGRNA